MSATIRKLLICATFLLTFGSSSVHAKWVKMRTDNFIVYSERNRATTLKLIKELEHFRSFILEFNPSRTLIEKPPLPIFVTRKRKYWKLTGSRSTAGLFATGANGPFALMSANERGRKFELYSLDIILHEYVHYLNSQDGIDLAPWLEEGLADFLSVSKATENGMVIGKVALSRLPALKLAKWYSTKDIMEAKHTLRGGGLFYAQSWLLVHMLHFHPSFSPKFQDLIVALVEGSAPDEALKDIYNMDFVALDVALKKYFDKGTLPYFTVPWTPHNIEIKEYTELSRSDGKAIEKTLRNDLKPKPATDNPLLR